MKITKRQLRRIIKEEKARILNEASAHTVLSLREEISEILDTLREISTQFGQGNHETAEEDGFTPEQGILFHEFLEDAVTAIDPIIDQLDEMSG